MYEVTRDTVREEVALVVHDTVRSKKKVVRVERDTVYIERKDSMVVRDAANISHQTSSISHLLKWMFAVICAVGVLIMVVKVKGSG